MTLSRKTPDRRDATRIRPLQGRALLGARFLTPLCREQRENRLFFRKHADFAPNYRAISAFSAKKPSRLPDIMSPSPLFSYTSPEVPSFLTSLWISAPFRTLKSTFVSRHNWHPSPEGAVYPSPGHRPGSGGTPGSQLQPGRGEPIARGGEAENRGAPFQGLMPTLPYPAPWALPRAVLGRPFGAEPLRSVRIFPVFLPGTLKPFASGQRALASRISVHWVIADVKYNIRVHTSAHKTGENGMAFSCRWGSLLGGCLIVRKIARACFC